VKKIIAEIPARYGSKRVKNKNLKLLCGKPLISYAINAAKNSKLLSDIYINTESDKIGYLADKYGVKYYKRDYELAQDEITSDHFNYDFMKNIDGDLIVMINPVAPLVTSNDIDIMIKFYLENDFDSLIPVREENLHAFYRNNTVNFNLKHPVSTFCESKPINFTVNKQLPMTQDIKPIQICVWTVCIWNRDIFIKSFEKHNHAVFSGKVGLYNFPRKRAVKISTQEDFKLAESILNNIIK